MFVSLIHLITSIISPHSALYIVCGKGVHVIILAEVGTPPNDYNVKIIYHIRILPAHTCFVLLKEGQFSNPSPPRPSSLIDEKPIPTNIKSSLPTYNFAKLNTATFVKPGTLGPSPGRAKPVSMRRRTRGE